MLPITEKNGPIPFGDKELEFHGISAEGANQYFHRLRRGVKFSSGNSGHRTLKKEYLKVHAAFAFALLLSLGAD